MTASEAPATATPAARTATWGEALRRLPAAARADRAVPRLLLRPAAGAVRLDAAGVDARIRRRSRHHRPVRAGRHALHHQVSLGAADRCLERAAAVARARPPPRLAGVLATAADRCDPVAGADRSGKIAVLRRARRAAGRNRIGDAGHGRRRISRREPARERTGRGHGGLCRRLSRRHADLHRRRAVSGLRLREHRHRQDPPRGRGATWRWRRWSASACSPPSSRPSRSVRARRSKRRRARIRQRA